MLYVSFHFHYFNLLIYLWEADWNEKWPKIRFFFSSFCFPSVFCCCISRDEIFMPFYLLTWRTNEKWEQHMHWRKSNYLNNYLEKSKKISNATMTLKEQLMNILHRLDYSLIRWLSEVNWVGNVCKLFFILYTGIWCNSLEWLKWKS